MSDLCNPELLEKIADGSATPAERASADAHAVECVTCARELAWQHREHALFAARGTRSVAPLWKDVEARIAAPPPRRHASWMAGLVAAAAAILLLVKSVPMALHHEAPKPVVVMPAAALPETAQPVANHPEERSWNFALQDIDRVVVYDVEGSVTVRGAERSDLRVVASHDAETGGWITHVVRKGRELLVRVECFRSCNKKASVDFDLELPIAAAAKVVVDTESADVVVDRVATVTVHSVSGDVQVNGAGARVSTTSGDVSITDAPSTATKIDSVSGDVSWLGVCAKGCDLQITTVSGDVAVTPEERSHFEIEVRSQKGSRAYKPDGPAGKIRVTTVSGAVEVPDNDGEHSDPHVAAGFTAVEPSGGLVAKVDIDVEDVAKIHVGERVEVEAKAGLVSTRGVVVAIDKEDETRGTLEVKIDLPDGSAKPGVSVLCKFGVASKDDAIAIGTASGGLVRSVEVKVGDEVRKGQVLVRLDASAAEAELATVDAEVKRSDRAYEQMVMLFKAGAATTAQVDQARSAIAISKTKRTGPEQRLALATVHALTHGYVKSVLVRPGETVEPNAPVVTISASK